MEFYPWLSQQKKIKFHYGGAREKWNWTTRINFNKGIIGRVYCKSWNEQLVLWFGNEKWKNDWLVREKNRCHVISVIEHVYHFDWDHYRFIIQYLESNDYSLLFNGTKFLWKSQRIQLQINKVENFPQYLNW